MRVLTVVLLPILLAGFVGADTHDRPQVSTTAAFAAQSPCQFTTFEEQTSFTRRFYSKAEYDRAKTKPGDRMLEDSVPERWAEGGWLPGQAARSGGEALSGHHQPPSPNDPSCSGRRRSPFRS